MVASFLGPPCSFTASDTIDFFYNYVRVISHGQSLQSHTNINLCAQGPHDHTAKLLVTVIAEKKITL